MFGALGLAVDSSTLFFHRQMAQGAADAAAIAAIMSVFQGTNIATKTGYFDSRRLFLVPAIPLRSPANTPLFTALAPERRTRSRSAFRPHRSVGPARCRPTRLIR